MKSQPKLHDYEWLLVKFAMEILIRTLFVNQEHSETQKIAQDIYKKIKEYTG